MFITSLRVNCNIISQLRSCLTVTSCLTLRVAADLSRPVLSAGGRVFVLTGDDLAPCCRQVAEFRALRGLRSRPIGHNYRIVQLAHGRQVLERQPLDESALDQTESRRTGRLETAPTPSAAAPPHRLPVSSVAALLVTASVRVL